MHPSPAAGWQQPGPAPQPNPWGAAHPPADRARLVERDRRILRRLAVRTAALAVLNLGAAALALVASILVGHFLRMQGGRPDPGTITGDSYADASLPWLALPAVLGVAGLVLLWFSHGRDGVSARDRPATAEHSGGITGFRMVNYLGCMFVATFSVGWLVALGIGFAQLSADDGGEQLISMSIIHWALTLLMAVVGFLLVRPRTPKAADVPPPLSR